MSVPHYGLLGGRRTYRCRICCNSDLSGVQIQGDSQRRTVRGGVVRKCGVNVKGWPLHRLDLLQEVSARALVSYPISVVNMSYKRRGLVHRSELFLKVIDQDRCSAIRLSACDLKRAGI